MSPTSPLQRMTSYAQNAEDVVLRRAFEDVQRGFYVDVGASDPLEDSVTLHFYERGWKGVNIEPDPDEYARLVRARPRDVNLNAAVGLGDRPVTLYRSDTRGHGTLGVGTLPEKPCLSHVLVEQVSLSTIFADYVPEGEVEFLKVDVEGWEADVLASADWEKVRPRIIVVEAVDAYGTATHDSWEHLLLDASYRFALFDGLNRMYCREEDAYRLLPRVNVPANVFDNWYRYRETVLEERIARAESSAGELRRELADEVAAHAATHTDLEEAQWAYASAQRAQTVHIATRQAARRDARVDIVAGHCASPRSVSPGEDGSTGFLSVILLSRLARSATRDDSLVDEDPILEVCGVRAGEILRRCSERRGRTGWRLIDFADLSDERFVRQAHLVLLARLPSPTEEQRRIADLHLGSSRFEIVIRLALSPEGRALRDRPLAGVILPVVAAGGRALQRATRMQGVGRVAQRLERSVSRGAREARVQP